MFLNKISLIGVIKLKAFLCLFVILISSHVVHAESHSHDGKVVIIASAGESWGNDSYVQIEGLNDSNCGKADLGFGWMSQMVVPANDDRVYSLLIAAQIAGKTVRVVYDDALKKGDKCTITWAMLLNN